jgi:hypothetical protein
MIHDGPAFLNPPAPLHGCLWCYPIVRIDVSEKDEKSGVCAIALRPAHSLGLNVTGPDGKPVSGAYAAGLHAVWQFGRRTEKVQGDSARVHGLTPKDEHAVMFIHPEKKLARVQKVTVEDKEPLTVRLEPMGALAGRVLDSAGRPRPGVNVKASYRAAELEEARKAGKDYEGLPRELLFDYPAWAAILNREVTTDKDGKFRIDGLIPGLKYDLGVNDGTPEDVLRRERLTVEPGKANDLGDLK